MSFLTPETLPWAERFNDAAKRLILAADHDPLIDWPTLGPDAEASINSAEHYLPLLYVLGAQTPGEPVSFFTDDVFAAISMTGVTVKSIVYLRVPALRRCSVKVA